MRKEKPNSPYMLHFTTEQQEKLHHIAAALGISASEYLRMRVEQDAANLEVGLPRMEQFARLAQKRAA